VAQDYGPNTDLVDTWSPTPAAKTMRLLFAFSALREEKVASTDWITAYIQAPIGRDVYVEVKGEYSPGKDHVAKLHTNLYGLKDGARNWHVDLASKLVARGWTQSKLEPSLFWRFQGKRLALFLIHVDDGLVTCSDGEEWKEIVEELRKDYRVKDLGWATDWCGVQIEQRNDGNF
jgi:hypothetical protein